LCKLTTFSGTVGGQLRQVSLYQANIYPMLHAFLTYLQSCTLPDVECSGSITFMPTYLFCKTFKCDLMLVVAIYLLYYTAYSRGTHILNCDWDILFAVTYENMMETQINTTQMWKSKEWYYCFSKMQKKIKTTEGKLNAEPEHVKLKNYFEHQIAHLSIPCQLSHRQCHLSTPNAKFHSHIYK
jgi:hypothetical protein